MEISGGRKPPLIDVLLYDVLVIASVFNVSGARLCSVYSPTLIIGDGADSRPATSTATI
jgi:hypothetical protein